MIAVLIILFTHTINGQPSCSTSRSEFQNSFNACLLAFEGAAFNASHGYTIKNGTIDLVCNATCQTAVTNYAADCSSNEAVSLPSGPPSLALQDRFFFFYIGDPM